MPNKVSHYLLFEQIGAGGMGSVYRAEDELDGSAVAVKLLHPHMVSDPEYVHRFQREAEAAEDLDSPYLIPVLDFGQDGETYFVVMPFVPGETLADLIQRRGRLPIGDVITAATAIAHALAEGNRRGIVHRGISPQNVMITQDGEVQVMGFGVPRDLTDSSVIERTLLGGRPFYMAPEMPSETLGVDVSADIYALGVTLFEMLVGNTPFNAGGDPQEQLSQRTPNVLELRSDTPAWLAAIMYRCFATDPARRFHGPEEVVSALELADYPQPAAVNPTAIRGRVDTARRHRLLLVAALATFLILAVYGGLALTRPRQSGEPSAALALAPTPIQGAEESPTPEAVATAVLGTGPLPIPPTADIALAEAGDTDVVLGPTATEQTLPAMPATSTPASLSDTPATLPASASSTPMSSPATATIAAVDCAALATVSDITPPTGSTQIVIGQYSCGGKPVSGVAMAALFSFGTSTGKCTSVSDDRGVATCSLGLQAATPGQFVSVSICFAYQGTSSCRQTGFTPQ